MCNEAARRTALNLIRDDFRQVRIPLVFPEGLPNLQSLDSIRITDPTVIVRAADPGSVVGDTGVEDAAAGDMAAEMVQRRWSWVGPSSARGAGKPVYNFRSEGRTFANTSTGGRCLIPLDGFYEFTDAEPSPGEPRPKRKAKWLFTQPGPNADPEARTLFCVAGLWRAGVSLGKDGVGEAFTMLTCEPGPDIAPYHSRQIVLMPRAAWADWLGGVVPAADLIRPTPAGTLRVVPAR